MPKENTTTESLKGRFFIDLDWYEQNRRSFSYVVRNSLCDKCRRRVEEKELPPDGIVAAAKDCCAGVPDFINDRQPILESVFRIFLSNGNEPLELEELSRQLAEWRGGDTYRTAPHILSRLLRSESYYGIRPSQG